MAAAIEVVNMELLDEMIGLIDAFQQAQIDYAVCGGIAMAFHGHSRFTKDIDLLIREDDLSRVLAVAKERGFSYLAHPMTFATGTTNEIRIQRVTKVVGSQFMILDLVLVGNILEDVW